MFSVSSVGKPMGENFRLGSSPAFSAMPRFSGVVAGTGFLSPENKGELSCSVPGSVRFEFRFAVGLVESSPEMKQ